MVSLIACSDDFLDGRPEPGRCLRATTAAGAFYGRSAPRIWVLALRRSCVGILAGSSETAGPADRLPPFDPRSANRQCYARNCCETLLTRRRILRSSRRRFATDGEVHDLVTQPYLLDNEPGARRQQQLWIHGPPCGWPSDPPGRRGLFSMWRPMNAATLSSVESAGRFEGAGAGPTVFRYGTCEPDGLFGRPPVFTQLRARQGTGLTRIGVWHQLPSTAPNLTGQS